MKRPAGVTASAVVAIIGSLFVLAAAGFFVVASFSPLPTGAAAPAIPDYSRLMRGAAFILVAFAAMGLTTGVGLLKLRPWARVSMLVFGGIMAAMCLAAGLSIAALPLVATANLDPRAARMLRPMLGVIYGVPFLIGVWWLVQFNRRATKEAFEGPAELAAPGARPLSVTIIGWWLLVGGALSIMPAFSKLPALLFGGLFTGWAATMIYVVFAALQISAGTGVLKLQEPARVLAIAWFLFGVTNLLFMAWRPGIEQRVEAYQRMIGALPPGPAPFDMVQFMRRMTVVWVAAFAVPVWFLVRRRAAFHSHAAD